jgi:hypothetical protein
MQSKLKFAIVLTLGVLSSATAIAQSAEEQQACVDDAFRVCSATIPDRARTTACMIANKAQLSGACQAVMAKYAPANDMQTAQVAATPVRPAKPAKAIKTAVNATRPGKPLNILPR